MVSVQNGIVRPQQIQNKEHQITSTHKYIPAPVVSEDGQTTTPQQPESIETYKINITSFDARLTDFLTRLISGVLYTNGIGIQNAEENILREMGKWNDDTQQIPADITKEPVRPTAAPAQPKGQGDGN